MDVFAMTMRLKEEGAAQVKASVDKLRVTVDEAVASTKKLDAETNNIAAAQRAWAAETRNLKSSMASGNMSLADASTRYDAMIAKMGVANALGEEQKAVVEKTSRAMGGQATQLRTLRDGLSTLASSMVGVNAVGFRLGSTLGTMAAGQGLMIGVLAGVAAIGYAYEKLTATTKKLVAEQDEAVAALKRVAEQQRFGAVGELATQISKGTLALNKLRADLKKAEIEASTARPSFTAAKIGTDITAQTTASAVAAAKNRVKTLKEAIASGERELKTQVEKANADASTQRSQQLRDLVRANQATIAEQKEYVRQRQNIQAQLTDKTLSADKRQALVAQLEILTPEKSKAVKTHIELLIELNKLQPLAADGTADLVAEEKRLTNELKTQSGSLLELVRNTQELANVRAAFAIEDARTIKDIGSKFLEPMPLPALRFDLERFKPSDFTGEADPKRLAEEKEREESKIRNRLKKDRDFIFAETEKMANDVRDGLANTLGDALVTGIQAAFVKGANFGDAMKAFGVALLGGIGNLMVTLGQRLVQLGTMMKFAMESFAMNHPGGMIVAGLAMIAVGAALRGAASRAMDQTGFNGGGGGGGGGYSAPAMGGNMTMPTAYYGPTSAGSANTIKRINPISVTIIGPNDPTAQRQMQELLRNAQRRGNV